MSSSIIKDTELLGDRLFIKRIVHEKSGDIYLPDQVKGSDIPDWFEVVNASKLIEDEVKVGDKVLCEGHSLFSKEEGCLYYMVRLSGVLAKEEA